MKENVLRKKSLTFAVRIVNLSKYLRENKKELRCQNIFIHLHTEN